MAILMNQHYKRFVVQIGMGVDQHGHDDDCTNAAIKAIKNAISNNCLTGIADFCNFKEPKDLLRMKVHVKIGAPYPDKIDEKKVLKAVPFGEKSLEVEKGGLVARGIMIRELGDTSDKMIICNAAVEVLIKDA
ncbi:MAG: Lin0512 family protein [Promethearchaeota archaeon]